jgi:hypothetical protein
MSLIAISSLLLGITIAQLQIQVANKPPEPPPKKKLLVEDIQGIVVVYAGDEKSE